MLQLFAAQAAMAVANERTHHAEQRARKTAIVGFMGKVYEPYAGRCCTSEAHGSDLCAVPAPVKAVFPLRLLNLALIASRVSRHEKSGRARRSGHPG